MYGLTLKQTHNDLQRKTAMVVTVKKILYYFMYYFIFGGGRGFAERELHVTENYSRHLLSPDAELLQAQVERVWWSLSATLHNFYCLLLRTTKSGSGWSTKKPASALCKLIIRYMCLTSLNARLVNWI